jgi:hypothetical protein
MRVHHCNEDPESILIWCLEQKMTGDASEPYEIVHEYRGMKL